MGIQGLLQVLKPLVRDSHVKDFRGQSLAIDGFSWLHKSTYGCALELCLNQPTRGYINYMLRKCELLRQSGVTPVVVFDGAKLEWKSGTNEKRSHRRKECFTKGLRIWESAHKMQKGPQRSKLVEEARAQFQQGVSITPEMVTKTCKALIAANIRVIVAPFEADAQLAYLCKIGHVQGVITEDSDLLVFLIALNVKSVPILTKMNQYGEGKVIFAQPPKRMHEEYLNIYKHEKSVQTKTNKFIPLLRVFDCRMFVQMCVLVSTKEQSMLKGS